MDDDQRQTELDCIAAIFPEIVFDTKDAFSASIDIPVHPQNPVRVTFPASTDGCAIDLPAPPVSATIEASGSIEGGLLLSNGSRLAESHQLAYLPSLQLRMTLPVGYPETLPPKFRLTTSPTWLSRDFLDKLEVEGIKKWEEAGHDLIIYDYIDSLQQAAEIAFGYGDGKVLEVALDFKIALLDYDIKARQAAFDGETFDCGICLDPKKGSVCHRMIDCGHVFCIECLQYFYNNAIAEGDLVNVRCLTPGCAKERADAQRAAKRRKLRTQLSPSELLQIPLEHSVVQRYVDLKHKADLESDKNTVYCPRQWCQGAARSKHRKPEGFEETGSDKESDAEDGKCNVVPAIQDRLAICEDCDLAFCKRCYGVWHGELTICTPKRDNGQLTEEEKASVEYMKLHTTPCPTCAAPAQKTHGCNHMICYRCNTHFCYLCSAWLEPGNPYKHYNMEKTSCYMHLWELERGDGDDVGIGYAGGQMVDSEDEDDAREEQGAFVAPAPAPGPRRIAAAPARRRRPAAPAIIRPDAPALEREGPLVLRINQAAPPPAPAQPAVAEPRSAGRGRARGGNNRGLRGDFRGALPGRGRAVGVGRGHAPVPAPGQLDEAPEAVNRAWVRRFVQMALNDEEDQLEDSDDDEDAAWEIPVR